MRKKGSKGRPSKIPADHFDRPEVIETIWKNAIAQRASLERYAERQAKLAQTVAPENAVEQILVGRLSDREFEDYVTLHEPDSSKEGYHPSRNEEDRIREVLRRLGLSADWNKTQFSVLDLLNVQWLMQDHFRVVEKEFWARIDDILKSKKSIEAKLLGLKKFVKEQDPKRRDLFMDATEIYAQGATGRNPRLKPNWKQSLDIANRRKKIYSEDEFDESFSDIEAHFRQWRSRYKDLVRRLISEAAEKNKENVTTVSRR